MPSRRRRALGPAVRAAQAPLQYRRTARPMPAVSTSQQSNEGLATQPIRAARCWMSAKLADVFPKLLLPTLCVAAALTASLPAAATGPPLPVPIVPNSAQERLQAQIAIQQAQAQARLAASQASVQAQLDANQARLEGQLAAQQAGTQAQIDAARQSIALAGMVGELPPPMVGRMQQPSFGPIGTMELTTLTPRLGSYFGTDHGVLVVRAPTHGVLKLQDGDVIVAIGGRVPANSSQAIRILTSYDPGEKITLLVLRQHHRIEMTATMPAAPPAAP